MVARPGREKEGVPTCASMSDPRLRSAFRVGMRLEASSRRPSTRRIVTLEVRGAPVGTGAWVKSKPGSKFKTQPHKLEAKATEATAQQRRPTRTPADFINLFSPDGVAQTLGRFPFVHLRKVTSAPSMPRPFGQHFLKSEP